MALPNNTAIYCTHEYTLSNLAFAKAVMPNNKDVISYSEKCEELRHKNTPTLPTSMSTEKKINPFLDIM